VVTCIPVNLLNPKPLADNLHNVQEDKLTTKGMKTMYEYRLNYLYSEGDMNTKKYQSTTPVNVGDVIYPDEYYYHQVTQIHQQKTGVLLDLSKSAQSPEEAILLREQSGRDLKY